MKSWWLKLYTIPQIKRMSLSFLVVFIIVGAGHFITEGSGLLLFYMSFLYPFFVFCSSTQDGMLANLEFHKMTVHLSELRKAFYKDILIQTAAFLLLGICCVLALNLFFGSIKSLKTLIALSWATPSVYLFLAGNLFAFLVSLKSTKIPEDKKKLSKNQKISGFFVMMAMILFFSNDDSFINSVFSILSLMTVVCATCLFYFYQTEFHEKKKSRKDMVSTVGKGVFGSVVYCLLCAVMMRFEMNNSFFSFPAKLKTVYVFSDLMPELEPHTVKGLLKIPLMDSAAVLKHADPEIYQMPVTEIIPDRTLYRYKQYLTYGKPAASNLLYIMKELEKHPDRRDWPYENGQAYKEVRLLLVHHFPDAKSLPAELIKSEITKKIDREMASDR